MKTTKTAVILLALVLLTAAIAQPAEEKPAKKEISNTRTASCLVKITSDPAVLPLSDIAIDYLLRSSGVAGKAARDILNISPDIASELFIFEDIEKMFPDSAGLLGIPPGAAFPGAAVRARTSPSAARTRTATTRTARPGSTGTTTRTPTARTARTGSTTTASRPPTRRPTSPRRKPTVTQPLRSATEQTILFRLHVDFDFSDTDEPIKPAAEEFMIALIENLRGALRGAFDDYRTKVNQQFNLTHAEAANAEADLMNMQKKLREISDSRDLSRYVIHRDISNLRQKLQSTTMQRASDETLYKATANRIAKEQARRKELAENDSITNELMGILRVHEGRLKETLKLYEAGNASAAHIQDIKEKIIRARIELVQRSEHIINPPGSIEISSLNDEMATLATNMALTQQETQSLKEQFEQAKDLLQKADPYELLSLKADIAKQNLEEALLWRARLGRNIRSIQPPDVTVIGAE